VFEYQRDKVRAPAVRGGQREARDFLLFAVFEEFEVVARQIALEVAFLVECRGIHQHLLRACTKCGRSASRAGSGRCLRQQHRWSAGKQRGNEKKRGNTHNLPQREATATGSEEPLDAFDLATGGTQNEAIRLYRRLKSYFPESKAIPFGTPNYTQSTYRPLVGLMRDSSQNFAPSDRQGPQRIAQFSTGLALNESITRTSNASFLGMNCNPNCSRTAVNKSGRGGTLASLASAFGDPTRNANRKSYIPVRPVWSAIGRVSLLLPNFSRRSFSIYNALWS